MATLYEEQDNSVPIDIEREKIYKEGWLFKRGHVIKNWKRRYFILTENAIKYFSKKPVSNFDASQYLKGAINLQGSKVFANTTSTDASVQFKFGITSGTGKEYLISCYTEFEMQAWVKSIQSVISKEFESNKPQEIPRRFQGKMRKSGWLQKRGHLVKNWKRRYFILTDVAIIYFDQPPMQPGDYEFLKGSINLVGCSIKKTLETAFEDKRYCFGLAMNDGEEYFIAADTSPELEEWTIEIKKAMQKALYAHLHKHGNIKFYGKENGTETRVLCLTPSRVMMLDSETEAQLWSRPIKHIRRFMDKQDYFHIDFGTHAIQNQNSVNFTCSRSSAIFQTLDFCILLLQSSRDALKGTLTEDSQSNTTISSSTSIATISSVDTSTST